MGKIRNMIGTLMAVVGAISTINNAVADENGPKTSLVSGSVSVGIVNENVLISGIPQSESPTVQCSGNVNLNCCVA